MQRKPLPRPQKDNSQIKEYTSAIKRGQKGYYVSPSEKGWTVRKANASKASGRFSTKAEAISQAKKSASRGADVVIYSKNGKISLLQSK